MSRSMDPHLYGRGCSNIFVCITYIYIVYMVAMSKFESPSHGSTLYYSSHDCLCLTWICVVLVNNHVVSHMYLYQSVNVL